MHLGHENAIRFDKRPFNSIEEMEDGIVANWNSVVTDSDTVYHLGDFCWGRNETEWCRILDKLNGNKIFIRGNHDFRNPSQKLRSKIEGYYENLELTDNNHHIILNHYPIHCYKGAYNPDCFMLYGHVHITREDEFSNKWALELRNSRKDPGDNCGNLINVGCMKAYMNYTPQPIEYLIDKINTGEAFK